MGLYIEKFLDPDLPFLASYDRLKWALPNRLLEATFAVNLLINARIRTAFRVSKETIDDRSRRLQVMSDRCIGM